MGADLYSVYRIVSFVLVSISLLLFFVAGRWYYPGFSIRTHWISNLGKTNERSHSFFVAAVGFLMVAGVFLLIIVGRMFADQPFIQLGLIALMLMMGLCLVFILRFPIDKYLINHVRIGYVVFIAVGLSNVLSLVGLLTMHPARFGLAAIHLCSIMCCILLLVGHLSLGCAYSTTVDNRTELRKDEKSPFIKGVWSLEWLAVMLNMIWFLAVSVIG